MNASLLRAPVRILLFVVTAALVSVAASAQTGLYVAYGASKVNSPTSNWTYGPTFGVYHDFYSVPLFHVGADLRGSVLGVNSNTTIISGMLGPRLSFHPRVLPTMPYIEALGGIGHTDLGQGLGSDTQAQYQLLAGLDITILPHIDWRLIEFSYGGLSALDNTLHPKTLSMGFVVRLP